MRIALVGAVLGAVFALASCGGPVFTCTITYLEQTGGPVVDSEEKEFPEASTPTEANAACHDYGDTQLMGDRGTFTCTCVES